VARYVLIVSSPEDTHSQVVAQWLRKYGLAEPVLFDFHDFPEEATITYQARTSVRLRIPGGYTLDSRSIAGVWWRRPQDFSFAKAIDDPSIQRFCEVNCFHAVEGLFQTLGERVIDPPFRMLAADRKLYQLALATDCGLRAPKTCATNDPREARRFVQSCPGPIVYKIFRGVEGHYKGTTLFEPSDLRNLDLLRHSPVIFQEFIEPGFDIRITAVGKKLFPAKLISTKAAARSDIRRDLACRIEPHRLPSDVERGVKSLVRHLGLRYCAIDMRASPAGEHYFLEANPGGQYLFIETVTNQRITDALSRLLANPEPANHSRVRPG
jgi:glutathione synthase/RimK-type ligase-like ATP-grasp enzyme